MSNWGAKHIQELVDAGSPLPTVNQIDLHPFMRHTDIVEVCERHHILLEVSVRAPSFLSPRPSICRNYPSEEEVMYSADTGLVLV